MKLYVCLCACVCMSMSWCVLEKMYACMNVNVHLTCAIPGGNVGEIFAVQITTIKQG